MEVGVGTARRVLFMNHCRTNRFWHPMAKISISFFALFSRANSQDLITHCVTGSQDSELGLFSFLDSYSRIKKQPTNHRKIWMLCRRAVVHNSEDTQEPWLLFKASFYEAQEKEELDTKRYSTGSSLLWWKGLEYASLCLLYECLLRVLIIWMLNYA